MRLRQSCGLFEALFRFAVLALLGAGAACRAAESATCLSADVPGNLFAEGAPLTLHCTPPREWPAGESCRLDVVDAAEQPVASLSLSAGGTDGAVRSSLTLDAGGRRYLQVRMKRAAHPETVVQTLTLAVVPAVAQDARFGFNARPEQATLVKRLGGKWVRAHIPWEQAGDGKPFDGKGIEKTIDGIHGGGCEVAGISSYSLPWASVFAPDDKRPMHDFFSPPRPAPWDAYIRDAAHRMQGKVPVFELWNEANFDMFWRSTPDTFEQRVADYSALLKRSAAILRQEAPAVRITNGSVVDTRESVASRFVEALLQAGCADAFDILNLHYYRGTSQPEPVTKDKQGRDRSLETYLGTFADMQRAHHLRKPVWMTEIGWPTVDPGGWGTVSELDQARFMVRSHVLCFAAGVETVLWFQLESKDFGICVEGRGPKPALPAYVQLVKALAGKPFRRVVAAGKERVYQFGGETGPQVWIAWGTQEATWTPPPGLVAERAETMLGEPLPLKSGAALAIGASPVYLFGQEKAASATPL